MNDNRFLTGQVAKELDFYRIRETIALLCKSQEGKELLLLRESTTDKEEISKLKKLGMEWNTYLHSSRPVSLSSWPPVKQIIQSVKIQGSTLSLEQVRDLGQFCIAQNRLIDSITSASIELDIKNLLNLVESLPSLKQAQNEIYSIIDESGELKDLPALRAIRNRIAALHKEIENSIKKYTSDSALNDVLQSNVPAFKADRELIAVKSSKRNQIKGIIHEVSSSGQTVYIEPEEIVRANNDLIQEEYQLIAETRKILKELTARLSEYSEDFDQSLKTMLLLDVTYASARYLNDINGIFAEDCDRSKEPPVIYHARHPLLGSKAVPVDITFMDGKNVLIITGPNTGGKTVTLKTVALFALLNQAGFPIPAQEGTRLPIFSSIFADIGDEQSIDESLSTFSSHMKKTALMIDYADKDSLILLDELASGTDPQEGGAIAMATLDSLIEKGSFVLVTTHHGILKNYGYTRSECINASVEFDNTTLAPTYRLLMGVPGQSHAIDIALRSGLNKEVIQKARDYLTNEQADVSTLIKGLNAKHTELNNLLQEQKILKADLEGQLLKVHEKEIKQKEKEIELKEAEHKQSSVFLKETRSKLENLVRELREGEITREKNLKVKQFIQDLTKDVDSQTDIIEKEKLNLETEKEKLNKEEIHYAENGMKIKNSKEHKGISKKKTKQRLSNTEALQNATVHSELLNKNSKKDNKNTHKEILFESGMEVYAGQARRKGILVAKVKDNLWSVQFGSFKMNVAQSQLLPVPDKDGQVPTITVDKLPEIKGDSEQPVFELRLLGMRYEEAVKALEHQLDLCTIHNFKDFSIIHGKGSGILQQAVRDYLSHYPGVKDFHFAQPEDGGSGKTYVSLF